MDIERYTILGDMVNLKKISDQEFRKEVDRHYEIVKRRQKRNNPE
jgi:formiminotetrahydrofolate cyclodeaminase